MAVIASIGHNLRRLADFSGRDSRAQFWPWAVFLFILAMVVDAILMMSMMAEMFGRIQRFVIEHPKDLPGTQPFKPGMSPFPPELMPDFSSVMLSMSIVNLVFLALVAASVARRLHDCDRTGLWGLAYLPFVAIGAIFGPRFTGAMMMAAPPNSAAFSLLMINNLIGFLVLILLIVQLASQGMTGPNRFGPDPRAAG